MNKVDNLLKLRSTVQERLLSTFYQQINKDLRKFLQVGLESPIDYIIPTRVFRGKSLSE